MAEKKKTKQDRLDIAFEELRQKAAKTPSVGTVDDNKIQIPILGRQGVRTQEISYILLSDIVQDEKQVRDEQYNDEEFYALVKSIREKGLLQPVLVTPAANYKYLLIAGNRRYRACMHLRETGTEIYDIPAKVLLGKVEDYNILEFQLIENLQRKNLNPVEEARGYYDYYVIKTGKTNAEPKELVNDIQNYERDPNRLKGRITGESPVIEEILNISGKSATYVKRLVNILRLPDAALKAISEQKLGKYQALAFVENINHEHFNDILEAAKQNEMTSAQIKAAFATSPLPPAEQPDQPDKLVQTAQPDKVEKITEKKRGGDIAFYKQRIVKVRQGIEKNKESVQKEYAEELLREAQNLVKDLKDMIKNKS